MLPRFVELPGSVAAGRARYLPLEQLIAQGQVQARPIRYEDFLPVSAAGIFASNLAHAGSRDVTLEGSHRDEAWLAEAMGRTVHDPMELYAAQQQASRDAMEETR